MSEVYIGTDLVGISLHFSSHLIQCWVICSGVSVVIFCNMPFLDVFPQQGSKAVLHPHFHLYTPQPSLCTAPVLALLMYPPAVSLPGNSGLSVA